MLESLLVQTSPHHGGSDDPCPGTAQISLGQIAVHIILGRRLLVEVRSIRRLLKLIPPVFDVV
ncbi:hypothetical protein D187_005243 [Cystobacter fuscus DSM 2262]|uniref:Uncharacterized protein n=1 Tax=Cystobacter fuscus (strain ATCC 25194 / DSM 2262 / NBRC 100088 / M29) TaxID=1242864 RepID=S9PII5_CYSF2|nr:hypothetical protein D187_005243 [Cystobacter fuscus DSM 2262]